MSRRAYLSLGSRAVPILYPDTLKDLVESMLGLDAECATGSTVGDSILIAQDGTDRYAIGTANKRVGNLRFGDALNQAMTEAHRDTVSGLPAGSVVVHAASLVRDGRAVLIPGQSRTGKSTLSAWLIDRGFGYLSDDVSAFLPTGEIHGVYRPLMLRADVWNIVSYLGWIKEGHPLRDRRHLVQAPAKQPAGSPVPKCGLILIPHFEAESPARLELVSAAKAATELMATNYSTGELADHGLSAALALARSAPAVRLTYSNFGQLARLEPFLAQLLAGGLDPAAIANVIAEANAAAPDPVPAKPAIPEATPKRAQGPIKLTIGMATYDDYDGVYFTIQALRMYHPDVMSGDVEILVLDNHPEGPAASFLKGLDYWIPNYRYVPNTTIAGTAVRDAIFSEAQGRYVLCIDCHIMIVPDGIRRLIAYYDAHPDTSDLLQGPLVYDGLATISTHFTPGWRQGMYGTWGTDPRGEDMEAEPFEIPMQGLGLFSCRKDAWLGFNKSFVGFGGEEGYIHEKFRQAGHRTLCLPFLRWVHRFARPGGIPYQNIWEDRILNYIIGHRELGLPIDDTLAHFEEHLGKDVFVGVRRTVDARLVRSGMPGL